MLKIYYCSPIDINPEKARKQIEYFKWLFSKYSNIEVYGAGFKDSPIISNNSSWDKKAIVIAYDYRILRNCDILFVNSDLSTFCAGTFMELEYAKRLGIYVLLLVPEKPKNIFLECLADKIIYSIDELEVFLNNICDD